MDRWARTDNAAHDNLQRLRLYTDISQADLDALTREYEAASNGHDYDALRRAAEKIEYAVATGGHRP